MTIRESVKTLRIKNPCLTLQQIADKVGLTSRERVRQILSEAGLQTIHYHNKKEVHCLKCGKITTHKYFCSLKCRGEYNHIQLECAECGKIIKRYPSQLLDRDNYHHNNGYFCSNVCKGKSFNKLYGWRGGSKRK